MSERIKFVSEYLNTPCSLSELCRKYGISRPTGNKWLDRFAEGGYEALKDRSRAPQRQANRTPEDIEESILATRDAHITWGAKKIKAYLERHNPRTSFPNVNTIHRVLKRYNRVAPRRRKRKVPRFNGELTQAEGPNDVWTVDFKGNFKLRNGTECYPLTIMDGYSRFIICLVGLTSVAFDGVQPLFEQAFRRFGMPLVIRSDNGAPFASNGIAALSRFTVWLMHLGIRHERITPGKPTENGKHERMHRTLKAEACRPAKRSFKAQNQTFDDFVREFNYERPHEALGLIPPADLYVRSLRNFPDILPDFEYPGWYEVRRVGTSGNICLHQAMYYLGSTLRREIVGFEPWFDQVWLVYIGSTPLGLLDEERMELVCFERISAKNKNRINKGWIPKSWAQRYPRKT